jgi:uncharacterized membrane protein
MGDLRHVIQQRERAVSRVHSYFETLELKATPRWLQLVLVAIIVFGAIVRFDGLDKKVYSHDETLTSLRTSGYLEAEYKKIVSNRTLVVPDLRTFQHANTQRDARSTIRTLAIDDPQHPPLYYLLERSWDALFGGSIYARRSLGAVFSLLTLPAIYWLCVNLAPRLPAFPLVATALFAISPFELEYTQQAREYTLWGLLSVVSCALFLRACAMNRPMIWIAYAASLAVGLYSHTFFVFVIAAQAVSAIYLAANGYRLNFRALFVCAIAAAVAYAPWALNLVQNYQTVQATNSWFAAAVPAPVYLYKWFFNLGTVFFDAEYENLLYSFMLLPLGALVLWSVSAVWRMEQGRPGVLILALFWTTVIPLLVQDLVHHESRATSGRYLLPACIAIDLAVAYWIALWLSTKGRRARFASVATGALLLLGLISWGVSAQVTSWYTASSDAPVLPIVKSIREQPRALILTTDSVLALQLSNYLPSTDRFVFSDRAPTDVLHAKDASLFLLEPSPAQCAKIANDTTLSVTLAYKPPFTDSPMLHMSFMDAPGFRTIFSALRKKMTTIHGDATGMFRLWRVRAANARQAGANCE